MNAQAHYLRLYKAADEILRQPNNPCDIRKEDGITTCTASRAGLMEHGTLCCTGCKYLGPNGCTVQSLSCKLGWCYIQHSSIVGQWPDEHPMFVAIKALRDEAKQIGLEPRWMPSRSSFEDVFGREQHGIQD